MGQELVPRLDPDEAVKHLTPLAGLSAWLLGDIEAQVRLWLVEDLWEAAGR